MKCSKKLSAFTLVELIIVLVVAATIAALAINNFKRTLERGKHDNARLNLIAIHSAEQIYFAQNGTFTLSGANLSNINTFFKLKIIDSDFNYNFNGNNTAFTITANRTNGQYLLTLTSSTPISDTNPSCSNTCP
jgi:prepilin-type N-terminal cleavage/methylation domain-containing protein